MITPETIAKLKEAAIKATPGNWYSVAEFVLSRYGDLDSEPAKFAIAICGSKLRSGDNDAKYFAACSPEVVTALCEDLERCREALEKIADPRKRDHKEPDAYTTLGCVMNIASEALSGVKK